MKCHTQECEKSAVLMAHDGPGGTTPHPWCWDCAAGKGKPLPIEFERLSLAGRLGDLRDAFAKARIPFLTVTWGDGDLDVSCASASNAFPFLLALNAARAKGSVDALCAWLCQSYEGKQPDGRLSKAMTYLWERANLGEQTAEAPSSRAGSTSSRSSALPGGTSRSRSRTRARTTRTTSSGRTRPSAGSAGARRISRLRAMIRRRS